MKKAPYVHKKIAVNVAIDLETLDLRPRAAVVSVGLAAFTVQGGIVGTAYVILDTKSQILVGRSVSDDTVAWWGRQAPEVRAVLDDPSRMSPEIALQHITSFFERFQNNTYMVEGVWGFGADFDNATLIDLFADYRVPLPWDYRANRCGRTLVAVEGTTKPASKKGSVHHNALDDAIWQAEYFRSALFNKRR